MFVMRVSLFFVCGYLILLTQLALTQEDNFINDIALGVSLFFL